MSENIISSRQQILNKNEKRDIQLSIALHSLVNFCDISCIDYNNGYEYKYKEKTVKAILETEKDRLENLKSGVKEQNSELGESTNKRKSELKYFPKEIAHTEFIVDNLNLGNLILQDSSFMCKNCEEFKNLKINNGIRVYIFCDKENKSLYVVSKGTAPGEFSVLPDMMFASEENTTTTNQEEKNDLININNSNKNENVTTENKNEDGLRKYAIGQQNIIFNSVASKLLEPYMDENGDFKNEWKNIYFIGHSSGGNKIMNLFANHILTSDVPNEELERCKCICINSIGWTQETKSYFEGQFKERKIDFRKFCDRVTDVKGDTDPISVINEKPIGKTVFMKSNGHYTEDINIDEFVDSPDKKYYMYAQFYIYIKNYLLGVKNPVARGEMIRTTFKAIDYWGCREKINVLGEDITTYRTKVFIIVLLVLVRYYLKALIVVYVFRIDVPIEINHKITTGHVGEYNNLIDNRDINQNQGTPLLNNSPFFVSKTQVIDTRL